MNSVFTYQTVAFAAQAQALADRWGLPCVAPVDTGSFSAVLTVTADCLELSSPQLPDLGGMHIDLLAADLSRRYQEAGWRRQPLARAVGLHKTQQLAILDLSAGLGRDAFLLSQWGASVVMLERHPAAAALLTDGLERAAHYCVEQGVSLRLVVTQASDYLSILQTTASAAFRVIYFDPMYPATPQSALNKKSLRLWRMVAGDDDDASEVLQLALACPVKRVVVKRPRLAPSLLPHRPPNLQFKGSSTRFDIYTII